MIAIDNITITGAEGRHSGEVVTVNDWPAATVLLLRWSTTAPKSGGYDKHDFIITFQDGETYEGRYDLKHHTVEWPNLKRHVVSFVKFMAGLHQPIYMSAKDYEAYVNRHDPQPYKDFLLNYLEG